MYGVLECFADILHIPSGVDCYHACCQTKWNVWSVAVINKIKVEKQSFSVNQSDNKQYIYGLYSNHDMHSRLQ